MDQFGTISVFFCHYHKIRRATNLDIYKTCLATLSLALNDIHASPYLND